MEMPHVLPLLPFHGTPIHHTSLSPDSTQPRQREWPSPTAHYPLDRWPGEAILLQRVY